MNKKLYRNTENKMIAGVCSGVGEYLNFDPTIVRLIWALIALSGAGLLAYLIAALGLSVRQAELLCKNMSKEPAPVKEPTLAVDYVAECEKSLSKHLGRGVKIVNGKRKGRFELEFYGQDDLQILLDALMKIER